MEASPFKPYKAPEQPDDEIARMESEGGPPVDEKRAGEVDYMQPKNPQTMPVPHPETFPQPEQPSQGQ
jgi:hypothetical protein